MFTGKLGKTFALKLHHCLPGTFSEAKTPKQLEIKFTIPLTSVFNDEQKAVRRKEYFVLVTMNPETIGTSELNTEDTCSWKNARSTKLT